MWTVTNVKLTPARENPAEKWDVYTIALVGRRALNESAELEDDAKEGLVYISAFGVHVASPDHFS